MKLLLLKIYDLYRQVFVFNVIRIWRHFFNKNGGINLIGYFSSTFGVAEVGRFFARQAMQVDFPFYITNIYSQSHKQLGRQEFDTYRPYLKPTSTYHKTIFFINADEIPKYYKKNRELFLSRYNAAVFFWEFDDYFDFPDAFAVLDEAIAFTSFIATAIQKSAPAGFKVTKLNFPFIKNWELSHPVQTIKTNFSLPEKDFLFFFNFDFHSIYERKNPGAILQAMDIAFGEQDNVTLILKTIHAEHKGHSFENFQAALDKMNLKQKVILINKSLERNEMMSMINATDSYISLHRSEGLGLGMMEAMSMGKPVIATAFGGNLDFMNEENALLVNYKLIPLEQDELPYKKGWLWAEPDIYMAASHMRKLYDDRRFAQELGKKGQAYIASKYNSAAFSEELQAWLHQK